MTLYCLKWANGNNRTYCNVDCRCWCWFRALVLIGPPSSSPWFQVNYNSVLFLEMTLNNKKKKKNLKEWPLLPIQPKRFTRWTQDIKNKNLKPFRSGSIDFLECQWGGDMGLLCFALTSRNKSLHDKENNTVF